MKTIEKNNQHAFSEKIILACGSDDSNAFSHDHFGSSNLFQVFEWDLEKNLISFIKEIENTSIKERNHGDPKKAESVSKLLKDIDIFVGYAMGPNIARIRKKFLPIISRIENIEDSLDSLRNLQDQVIDQLKDPDKPPYKVIKIHWTPAPSRRRGDSLVMSRIFDTVIKGQEKRLGSVNSDLTFVSISNLI